MLNLFIDTYYENASPLKWEQNEDGVVDLDVIHDHGRFSPNQQFNHLNFKIIVPPEEVGARLTVRIRPIMFCGNLKRKPSMSGERNVVTVSHAPGEWETVIAQRSDSPDVAVEFDLILRSETTQVADIVPYTNMQLQSLLHEIRREQHIRVYHIGATVEGRPLEMVEIGDPAAQHRVLLRARAHAWESGGSWLLDGFMRSLQNATDPHIADIRASICFCLVPMANKDGVYRGMSRFNIRGMDLNRGWGVDTPQDSTLAPENACLENWLSERQRQGRLPEMAICLHNDHEGKLHFSHPSKDADGHLARMRRFEEVFKEMTWFAEGSMPQDVVNPGSFGEGLTEMYGIDAVIYELNSVWAEGLGRTPLHTDWQQLGRDLPGVIHRYFREAP